MGRHPPRPLPRVVSRPKENVTSDVTFQSWVLPSTEILVVGLPFSAFKLLTGIVAIRGEPPIRLLGLLFIGLGALDLLLNRANLISLVIRRVAAVVSHP